MLKPPSRRCHIQAQLSSLAKEAELNARVLSLESQIHWLKEQNSMLQQQAAAANGVSVRPPGAETEELRGRCSALEQDLRKTKRAEQKLQALLFR